MFRIVKNMFNTKNQKLYCTNHFNLNRQDKLLEEFYKKKIERCKLCHDKNKCDINKLTEIHKQPNSYNYHKLIKYHCLK